MKYIVNLILIVVLLSSCSQQTCDTSAFDAGMAKFERNKAIADKTFNLFIAKDLDGMMDMHSEDLIWSPASTNDTLSKAAFREGIAKAKAEGKYKGRKPTARNKTDMVLMALKEGIKPASIMRELNISKTSYYRIIKEAS